MDPKACRQVKEFGMGQPRLFAVICLALAVVTLAVYWPVTHHDFIVYDDQHYVSDNTRVQAGLSWPGVVWAFKNTEAVNWHPLTWLSHMLDCQLFGLHAGGHHLTNLLFHIANTLLLFLWLNKLTAALWRSAFVAAFFAWHPLHVESVAWVAERKDVLSMFFWMLTLMAYTRHAQSRSRKSEADSQGSGFYALALLMFACGLMAKPMVVTLPFVLLLLDFWPLNRLALPDSGSIFSKDFLRNVLRLAGEKIPFFTLAVAGSAVTYLIQKTGGVLWTLAALPPQERVANALLSYARYIAKTFWPADLAVLYPHPHHWPILLTIGAALVLMAWTALSIGRARRNPYLVVGWFWFLGTLVPAIGLVQVGPQSMADRYTYIPSIGLFLFIVWGANDLFNLWREKKQFLPVAGGVALAGCLAVTSLQLSYWQNSFSLLLHTIKATTDNYVAYHCLGQAFNQAGRKEEAAAAFRASVQIVSNYPPAQLNLALALIAIGRPDKALPHYEAAARYLPHDPDLQYDVGKFLLQQDKPEEAIVHLRAALDNRPAFPEARNALGWAYLRQSKLDEAVVQFSEALRPKPDFAEAHLNLAFTLAKQGKTNEAFPHFTEAVRLQPANADFRFSFGLALLDHRQPAAAAAQFAEALKLTPNETKAHYGLALALQQQGKLAEAVPHFREALRLTPGFPEAKAALDQILSANPDLRTSDPPGTRK